MDVWILELTGYILLKNISQSGLGNVNYFLQPAIIKSVLQI